MKIILNPKYQQSEKIRFDYFRDQIVERVSNDKQYMLLDIGCSQLELGQISNIENFGLDVVDSELFDKNHFQKVNLNTVDVLPYDSHAFDFVVAGEILEHIEKPFVFFREVARILKPGGIVLLSTPNPYFYIEILKEVFGIKRKDVDEHLALYGKNYIVSFCHECGLELVALKRYKFWIPFIKLMILSVSLPPLLNYQNIFIFKKI